MKSGTQRIGHSQGWRNGGSLFAHTVSIMTLSRYEHWTVMAARPVLDGAFDAMRAWVENGTAPGCVLVL